MAVFADKYFPSSYFPHSYFAHMMTGLPIESSVNVQEYVQGNHMLYVHKLDVNWITDSSGQVEAELPKVYGFLVKAVITPGVVLPPLVGYDLEIIGDDGIDVLGGIGHDLDSVNKQTLYPGFSPHIVPVLSVGEQTIRLTNTGGSAVGNVRLYYVESLGKKNVA